ncbi:MAG: DUF1189 family protein [Eubacterium sp.]|nr:DUF1189 family protein [Eubacterium sp.]
MREYINDEERRKYEGEPPKPQPGGSPEGENGSDDSSGQSSLEFEVPKKMSVIEQFRISITQPKQLIGLSELSVGRFVRYTLFLGLLIEFMLYVIPVAATIIHVGGFRNLFENNTPEFSMRDGKLTAEEPFTIGLGTYEIVVNTKEARVPKDSLGTVPLTFAIGSERIQVIVTENGLQQVLLDQNLSGYFPDGFNKEMLISAIPGFYIALVLTGLLMMAATLVKYLLAALLYMLIANPIARNSGLYLNKGNVFRLCFYAQTIGMLLVNVNKATGGYIPGMIVSMVGIFITLRYIFKTFAPYMRYGTDE